VDITSVDNRLKRVVDPKTLPTQEAPSRARQIIRTDDVIVSTTRPNLNAVAHISADLDNAVCSTGFCVLRATPVLDPAYLFAFVQSPAFVQSLSDLVKGALYPAVTDTQVRSQPIPLPPLSEQQRIAALLRDQMAMIDQAGPATDVQIDAARDLPSALLREVFEGPEARLWPRRNLGEVLRQRKDMVHPRDHPRGAAIFVGLEHVEPSTGRRLGAVEVEMADLTGRKPRFYEGDIVYGYLRPYLNKVWVADFEGLCSVDQYVYEVRKEFADNRFIAWFMRSPTYLSRAPIDTTPGQLPRIRTEEVASVEVNLPALSVQKDLVARLRGQMNTAEVVTRKLFGRRAAIAEMKGSLLLQAFMGKI
jgi:type I restriction enzyme S subunit